MSINNSNRAFGIASAIIIFFIGFSASSVFAQNTDEYHKVEFYGGYSYNRAESSAETLTIFGSNLPPCATATAAVIGANYQTLFCRRRGLNGFDTSLVYNFNRYVGIKGNVTGHYKSEQFADTINAQPVTQKAKYRVNNFLVGIQIKDNRKETRLKPFGHALVGAARENFQNVSNFSGGFTVKSNVTSLAMKFGGGIDLRVSRRLDLRLIEADYNPVFTRDFAATGFPFSPLSQKSKTAHNFTVGFGIVIH